MEEINIYGVKHFLMEADLEAYPATPIYAASLATKELKTLLKVA